MSTAPFTMQIAKAASRTLACVVLGAVVLAGLGACTSLEVVLGMRIRLDQIPVTGVSAVLTTPAGVAPGKSEGLVIVTTAADAKTYVTEGAGQGNVLFDSFDYDTSLVAVSPHGLVSLPADPRVSEDRLPHLRITVKGHPEVSTELDVPVRYDVEFDARFAGRAGARGFDGGDGLNGSDGSTGSIDLTHPSPGGNGSDGTNGGDGGDGSSGGPGPLVSVWLTRSPGARDLVQARVVGNGPEQLFLIDPQRGSLVVESTGGTGGAPGRGGRGGRGGAGGSGTPSGMSGMNGRDGSDGHAGTGGAAGAIEVTVDPSVEGFLDRVQLASRTGDGGEGPAATISIEPVPPLW